MLTKRDEILALVREEIDARTSDIRDRVEDFKHLYGIFANDILIGVPLLASGLLCFYFASEGKKINYVLSFINDILIREETVTS